MKYRWLFIWITAYLFNFLGHTLFELNMSLSLDLKSIILDALSREEVTNLSNVRDYRFRVYWEASVLGSLFAYISAIAWGIRTYLKYLNHSLTHPILLIGVATIAEEVFRLATSGESSAEFNTIFCTTYDALQHLSSVTPDFMAMVTALIKIINFLAVCSPGILLMGICSALTVPNNRREHSLDDLIERDAAIDQSVLIGSLMMVMGLIHMGCWMDWPIETMADSNLKTAILALTASVYEYWGICFSILLLLIYAGSKWVWNSIVMDILPTHHPDIDPNSFVTDHGLGFRIRHHLPHAIAIILPVLSSMGGSGSSIFTMH